MDPFVMICGMMAGASIVVGFLVKRAQKRYDEEMSRK
jgi:hypothetical protein